MTGWDVRVFFLTSRGKLGIIKLLYSNSIRGRKGFDGDCEVR